MLPCDEEYLLACFEFYRYHELDLTCPSHLLRLLLPFQQYNLIRVPREARLVLIMTAFLGIAFKCAPRFSLSSFRDVSKMLLDQYMEKNRLAGSEDLRDVAMSL